MLKGRTWEEAVRPKKCYKGYTFSKGSKPSLQLAADTAKKAAEAEAAATASKEKGKNKGKGKEKESEPKTTSSRPPKPRSQPQPQQSQPEPQYHPVPELRAPAGLSSSSSTSSLRSRSQQQQHQMQDNPRSSNTYVLPRTAAQTGPARLAASGVPVGGSQQIHGFMNLYGTQSQPQPQAQRQRPSAVIDTRIPPHMMMTQEQFERRFGSK